METMATSTDYKGFIRTYRQHSALVWGIVLRFATSEAQAEDVTKDVFVRLVADGLCQAESACKRDEVVRITYITIMKHIGRQQFRKELMLGKELSANAG